MSKFVLTIDDFDPIVHYANPQAWQTPNPQEHPEWWNATREQTNEPWHQATYHNTSAKGDDSKFSFNFTGNMVSMYGVTGVPNYEIRIDGELAPASMSAAGSINGNGGRPLIYEKDVTYGNHTLEFSNKDGFFLLDSIEVSMFLGAESAEMKNTTVDDRDTSFLKFDGQWTQQQGPNFFDGTSSFTSADGASVAFNFSGSAVWVYGDQKNDHGDFKVLLNGSEVAVNNGRSGCGEGYSATCEKLHGLAFFAGSLPQGTHEVKIVNQSPGGDQPTFFDLDYIEYTTPSQYAPPELVGAATPVNANETAVGVNVTGMGIAGGSPSSSAAPGSSSSAGGKDAGDASAVSPSMTLGLFLGAWVLRALF